MSEQQPYEEMMRRQMEDLPLPDAEQAWQHMQRKLDEDDGKRRVFPPMVFNCLAWSMGLFLLLLVGWYLLIYNKEQKKPIISEKTEKTIIDTGSTALEKETANNKSITAPDRNAIAIPKEVNDEDNPGLQEINRKQQVHQPFNSQVKTGDNKTRNRISIKKAGQEKTNVNLNATQAPIKPKGFIRRPQVRKTTTTTPETMIANQGMDTKKSTILPAKVILHKAAHDVIQLPPLEVAVPVDSFQKKKESPQKKYYLTAGVGLQQVIPLDGQSTVPYNRYGRTGSLYDYIPSVYLRLHKGEKWFLQTEFRYGAPQSLKEFSFAQETKFDTANNNLSIKSKRLKKTYYHQLPVSLNYHVHKNLSLGIGGMYSYFYGAVTEEEVRNQNTVTGQESVSKKIMPVKSFTDSFLYKTQIHFLVQADYHWKRLNLGLRYATDLQPYIKYTLPDGTIRTEKNHSLQLFLRYRLFKM